MPPGAITALLGANGAGKSTTLKAVSGVLGSERGAVVTKGTITFDGRRIDGMPAYDVTRLGLAQVFEGRRVFEHLTCEDNLIAGGHVAHERSAVSDGIERSVRVFSAVEGAAPATRRVSFRVVSNKCWRSDGR